MTIKNFSADSVVYKRRGMPWAKGSLYFWTAFVWRPRLGMHQETRPRSVSARATRAQVVAALKSAVAQINVPR
jgi:hypothetical protein